MTDHSADRCAPFLVRLGAAMAAGNYPINLVRQALTRASRSYGLDAEFLTLPNYVHAAALGDGNGAIVAAARPDVELRYDQTFPLVRLVARAEAGSVTPADGEAELDRITAMPMRFRAWVTVTGYAIQSGGLALILQPSPLNLLIAAALGLVVGTLRVGARNFDSLQQLLPVICAFTVAAIAFAGARQLGLDHNSLRALIPPLVAFLPGVPITLAVIELSARDAISGSSRLLGGFIQIAQLAFGIVVAAQVVGVDAGTLDPTRVNYLGAWAPWLGVAVYAVGVMIHLGPPMSFLPWMLLIAYTAYGGQFLGHIALGDYANGFCGALVLTLVALSISRRRGAPPAVTLILPGFWLLVPGSLGLVGVTEIFGNNDDTAFTATLISLISIALGIQAGLMVWRGLTQLRSRTRHSNPR